MIETGPTGKSEWLQPEPSMPEVKVAWRLGDPLPSDYDRSDELTAQQELGGLSGEDDIWPPMSRDLIDRAPYAEKPQATSGRGTAYMAEPVVEGMIAELGREPTERELAIFWSKAENQVRWGK